MQHRGPLGKGDYACDVEYLGLLLGSEFHCVFRVHSFTAGMYTHTQKHLGRYPTIHELLLYQNAAEEELDHYAVLSEPSNLAPRARNAPNRLSVELSTSKRRSKR